MKRQKKDWRVTTIYLNPPEYEELREAAFEMRISHSEVIRRALREWLKRRKK